MRFPITLRPGSGRRAALVAALLLASTAPVLAQDNPALVKLKEMSDFLATQQTLHVTFDSDVEVLTPDLEKLQFTSSGEFFFQRPDKLHVRRTGGFSDVEMVFDGKTATITNLSEQHHAVIAVEGTVDDLRATASAMGGVALPGVDLLSSDAFSLLAADVLQAYDMGPGVIGGTECQHLAFRNANVDWQLWVAVGDKPVPCKLVVTSKTVTGSPQYTLRVRSIEENMPIDSETFVAMIVGPEVEAKDIGDIDEIPPADFR